MKFAFNLDSLFAQLSVCLFDSLLSLSQFRGLGIWLLLGLFQFCFQLLKHVLLHLANHTVLLLWTGNFLLHLVELLVTFSPDFFDFSFMQFFKLVDFSLDLSSNRFRNLFLLTLFKLKFKLLLHFSQSQLNVLLCLFLHLLELVQVLSF